MKNGYKLEDKVRKYCYYKQNNIYFIKCLRNELLILINYLMNDEKALFYFYEKQNVPSVQSPAAFLGYFHEKIEKIENL